MSIEISHKLIGKTVKSRTVGTKKAFKGKVVSAWSSNTAHFGKKTYLHVQDSSDGTLWHRELKDLVRPKATVA